MMDRCQACERMTDILKGVWSGIKFVLIMVGAACLYYLFLQWVVSPHGCG